uniref:Uncharacterized protein n=1 Tax=Erythrolobus australicus TaxID=1077150 RepID=A0A7S1XG89_9RHOD
MRELLRLPRQALMAQSRVELSRGADVSLRWLEWLAPRLRILPPAQQRAVAAVVRSNAHLFPAPALSRWVARIVLSETRAVKRRADALALRSLINTVRLEQARLVVSGACRVVQDLSGKGRATEASKLSEHHVETSKSLELSRENKQMDHASALATDRVCSWFRSTVLTNSGWEALSNDVLSRIARSAEPAKMLCHAVNQSNVFAAQQPPEIRLRRQQAIGKFVITLLSQSEMLREVVVRAMIEELLVPELCAAETMLPREFFGAIEAVAATSSPLLAHCVFQRSHHKNGEFHSLDFGCISAESVALARAEVLERVAHLCIKNAQSARFLVCGERSWLAGQTRWTEHVIRILISVLTAVNPQESSNEASSDHASKHALTELLGTIAAHMASHALDTQGSLRFAKLGLTMATRFRVVVTSDAQVLSSLRLAMANSTSFLAASVLAQLPST